MKLPPENRLNVNNFSCDDFFWNFKKLTKQMQQIVLSCCGVPLATIVFQWRVIILGYSQVSTIFFPWKSVWKVKVPPHVAFFLWTTAFGRILTVDTLRKRGFSLANWCCLCKKNEETTNHLLIYYKYTLAFWQLILNLFGVSWVMPSNIQELLHC